MGFSCSCGFLLLPVLVFLDATTGVELLAGLWMIGVLMPLPGLAFSIRASKQRDHLGRGLDVLTSLGVGLGWVGVVLPYLFFILVVVTLAME